MLLQRLGRVFLVSDIIFWRHVPAYPTGLYLHQLYRLFFSQNTTLAYAMTQLPVLYTAGEQYWGGVRLPDAFI
jgi:hypothetical protein